MGRWGPGVCPLLKRPKLLGKKNFLSGLMRPGDSCCARVVFPVQPEVIWLAAEAVEQTVLGVVECSSAPGWNQQCSLPKELSRDLYQI